VTKRKKTDKLRRVKESPLISDEMQQVFFYIAKGHHVKYACTLGGVNRSDFYRYIDEAKNEVKVNYATANEQTQFLKDYELANALYVDNRLDALNTIKDGNLNPSVFKQIQWELSVKDNSIYSNAATTKIEIKNQSNPLLEVWQSILNQGESDEDNE
jgi:hypothetical protein